MPIFRNKRIAAAQSAWLWSMLSVATAGAAEPSAKPPADAPPTLHTLFVGNSLTYTNNLPGLLRALAAAQPTPLRIETTTFAAPGGRLIERWRDGHVAKSLDAGHWDALILQDTGGLLRCIVKPRERKTELCRDSERAHREFAALAATHGTPVIMLGTWSRTPSNRRPLYEGERRLAQEHGMRLAPTGATLIATAERSGVKMIDDTGHPTLEASVIMAARLYRELTGKPAVAADLDIDFVVVPSDALVHPDLAMERQPWLDPKGKHARLPAAQLAGLIQVAETAE